MLLPHKVGYCNGGNDDILGVAIAIVYWACYCYLVDIDVDSESCDHEMVFIMDHVYVYHRFSMNIMDDAHYYYYFHT